jgi:hypothetical protein
MEIGDYEGMNEGIRE